MPHFSNKKLIILLVSVIFLVALISFSLSDRQNATFPERIIKDTVGFAQGLVAKPTNYIIGIFEDINSLFNTYEENKLSLCSWCEKKYGRYNNPWLSW